MIGQTETIIIIGVAVLLFGASAIPKLARAIGKARAEFHRGVKSAFADDGKSAHKAEK